MEYEIFNNVYAEYVMWDRVMEYINEPNGRIVISDRKDFLEHFKSFAKTLFMTKYEEAEGSYLGELLDGKWLWSDIFDDGGEFEGEENVDGLRSEQRSYLSGYIYNFWRCYVVNKNIERRIGEDEEVFWLIMAWIYVLGRINEDGFAIDKLKKIMCGQGKNKNINKVIQWIVGCYMNLNFLIGRKGEKQVGPISQWGNNKFFAGIYLFSEYFDYKKNRIEELIAESLEGAFKKKIPGSLSGEWYELVLYIENIVQLSGNDAESNDIGKRMKGLKFPISKKPRAPKHDGDDQEMSYYTGGARKGITEYFDCDYKLKNYLEEPESQILNDELNEKTAEICMQGYNKLKEYINRRFMASCFIRMWPRKDTYMSVGSVKHMLNDIEEMIKRDVPEQAQVIASVNMYLDKIYQKFQENVIADDDEGVIRNIFEAMGLAEVYECKWIEDVEEMEDESERIQEAIERLDQHIKMANLSDDDKRETVNIVYSEFLKSIDKKEDELVYITIYEVFNLDLEKLGLQRFE